MEIRGGNNGTHLTKLPELRGSIRRQRSHYFQTRWNHTQKRRLYNQPLVHIKIINHELCSLREEKKMFSTVYALCLYVSMYSHMYVCGCTHVCGGRRSMIDVTLAHSPLRHWALEGYSSSVTCVFHEVLRWELGFQTRPSCAYSNHFDNWAISFTWEIRSEKSIWQKEMQIYPWEKWTALEFRWWCAHLCLRTVLSVPPWGRKLMERRLCVCKFPTQSPLFFLCKITIHVKGNPKIFKQLR